MESILDTAQEAKDLWLDRSWALGEKTSTIFYQSRGFQPVGFVSFGGWITLSRGSPKTTGKQIFTLRLTTVPKLQTWSRDENNCYVWGHQNMRTVERKTALGKLLKEYGRWRSDMLLYLEITQSPSQKLLFTVDGNCHGLITGQWADREGLWSTQPQMGCLHQTPHLKAQRWRGKHKVPPLTKKYLASDTFRERKSQHSPQWHWNIRL